MVTLKKSGRRIKTLWVKFIPKVSENHSKKSENHSKRVKFTCLGSSPRDSSFVSRYPFMSSSKKWNSLFWSNFHFFGVIFTRVVMIFTRLESYFHSFREWFSLGKSGFKAVLERVRTRTRTQWVSPSPSLDSSPDSDSTHVDSDSDSDSTSVDSDSSAVNSNSGLIDSDSDSTQVDLDSHWVQVNPVKIYKIYIWKRTKNLHNHDHTMCVCVQSLGYQNMTK